jgi:uncharacterized protein YacL
MKPKGPGAPVPEGKPLEIDVQPEKSYLLDMILVRTIFAIVLTVAAYHTKPFGLETWWATVAVGLVSALAIIYFEHRLKTATLKRLIGAAVGSTMGIIGAYLITELLTKTVYDEHSLSFIKLLILFLMTYVGLVVGANKGDFLNLAADKEGLQDSRHQRHHRRTSRGYLRNGLP